MRNLQITVAITNRESASTETYFNDISKTGLLSADEEVALAQRIKAGDQEALDRLVRANLRFVVSVAKKYQHQGLSLNDLISEGNLGLIKAAKRFDETRGFKFISFAVWWIRQGIMAAIDENSRMIRLPQNKINQISKINKAKAVVEQELSRKPANKQLAEFLDMPLEKVDDALYYAPWTISYDTPLGGEYDYSLLDKVPIGTDQPDAVLMAESSQSEIDCLLSNLSHRERRIVELSYGLGGGLEMSPVDISKVIGMSAERIRQIRDGALVKLRYYAPIAV